MGIGQQVEASAILERFTQICQEIWGKDITEKMRPLYLKNRTITIASVSSSLAQEIKLREREILGKINKEFGPETAERIRYLV